MARQPLHPSVRQRRNVAPSAATLTIVSDDERAAIEVPELPADRMWDPKTSEFWRAAWQSPMRLEWDEADHHKLLISAMLLDELFVVFGNTEMKQLDRAYALNKLSKSLMDLGVRMGLDPLARRSLQWVMAQTDESEERVAASKERRTVAKSKRSGLSALG